MRREFDTWLARLERLLGRPLQLVGVLCGGYEATVLHLRSQPSDLVLHASPSWRSARELRWIHALANAVHQRLPEAVVPLSHNGDTVIEIADRCLVLYPYIDGQTLDRENANLRAAAAAALAEIHSALLSWSGTIRPRSNPPLVQRPDPRNLCDPDLDAWWLESNARGLIKGPTHGDYYRGNILCRDEKVVGIIDWHEASTRSLLLELSGATFEFARDDDHKLQIDRAKDFVQTYKKAGGPIPDAELSMLMPMMRWWIREDARTSLACTAAGEENDYAQKQIDAFVQLRSTSLDIT